jgi:hypothetical protein
VALEGGGVGGGGRDVDVTSSLVGTGGELELVSRRSVRHSDGVHGV